VSQFSSAHQLGSAHVFCDTGQVIPVVLTEALRQLTGEDHHPRGLNSIPKFLSKLPIDAPVIIVFDSFDLLDQTALVLFRQIEAIVDQQVFPWVSFVIVSHSSIQSFTFSPLSHLTIIFPPYSRAEVIQIVQATLHVPEVALSSIIDICSPLSCDLRDIIFVVHTLGADIQKSSSAIGSRVISLLDTMRAQQISRINDLARTASAILIAAYIASRTSIVSDLLKFARTVQKKHRRPKLLEEHEWIASERVFALAKAIIDSHMGRFETDFSMQLQLQKLIELGLIDLRGDFHVDPKIACLATDQEINAIADAYNIRLNEYLAE
jgi:Cdc6-like AAA superfamily ATPase